MRNSEFARTSCSLFCRKEKRKGRKGGERWREKKRKLDKQDLFSFEGGSLEGGEEGKGGRGGISRIRAEQSPLRGAE